jgi:alcohol dehydrogenase YqhD (iron-dependent ADH family)
MKDFLFYTPTKVAFGRSAEGRLGELLREQGCRKVLLHFGGKSAERSGLLGRVRGTLKVEGIDWVELGGVVPNPRLSLVYEGVGLGRREGVDFILAVGGGSVIDSAKAIGYGLACGGDVWEVFERKREVTGCTPIGVVLTIAATGSEMSSACVITSEDGWVKRGCTSDLSRPRFAVMDPQLTMTLPDYHTASGCVDIMMHTMERWFYGSGGMDVTESIAAAIMRTTMKHALILRDDPQNYESRAEIFWAGTLSHNGLTGCGTDGGDWAPHKIEHEISGLFDVIHGAGLAAIYGSWARYVSRQHPERFVRFAQLVMNVSGAGTDQETALKGIEAFEEFCRAINMPTSIRELGIEPTDEQLREMAEKCISTMGGPVGKVMQLNADDVYEIYKMAL